VCNHLVGTIAEVTNSALRDAGGAPGPPPPWSVTSTAPPATLRALSATAWDVIVVGSGNAALVAALSARHSVEHVLVIERAPRHLRGGNTRHTRNIRCAHDRGDEYVHGTYSVDELTSDLQSVGRGPVNPELARFAVERYPEPQPHESVLPGRRHCAGQPLRPDR